MSSDVWLPFIGRRHEGEIYSYSISKREGQKQNISPNERNPTNVADPKIHHITTNFRSLTPLGKNYKASSIPAALRLDVHASPSSPYISRSRSRNRQSVLDPRRPRNILHRSWRNSSKRIWAIWRYEITCAVAMDEDLLHA